jgi:uncharacterized protein YhdP
VRATARFGQIGLAIIVSRTLRLLIVCVLSGILLLALLLRLGLWQQSAHFKPYIEQFLSNELHAHLTINSLETSWQGITPIFSLNGLVLRSPHGQTLFGLEQAQGKISWDSLIRFSVHLDQLDLNNVFIHAQRQQNGSIFIAGQKLEESKNENPMLEWLLATHQATVHNTQIDWQDALIPSGNVLIRIPNITSQHIRKKTTLATSIDISDLDFSAQLKTSFSAGLFGSLSRWQDWSGTMNWHIPTFDLAKAQEKWHFFPMLQHGIVQTSGSIDFAKGMLHKADIEFSSSALAQLKLNESFPVLDIQEVNGILHYQKQKNQYHQLNIESLNWRYASDQKTDGIEQSSLIWQTHTKPEPERQSLASRDTHPLLSSLQYIEFSVPKINLTSFSRLARSWNLSDQLAQTINTFQPRGELEKIHGYWHAKKNNLFDKFNTPQYAIQMRFRQLGIGTPIGKDLATHKTSLATPTKSSASVRCVNPYSPDKVICEKVSDTNWPSFDGLSGELKLDDSHGTLALESHNSTLVLPDIFTEPLFFHQIDGELSWDRSTTELLFSTKRLLLVNSDLHSVLSGSYAVDTQHIGLDARITDFSLASLHRYLPKQVGVETKDFFKQAKLAGKAAPVRIALHGSLKQFPYTHPDQGVFKIDIPLSEAFLELPVEQDKNSNAKNHWPAFEKINGVVTLEQDKLSFEIKQSKVLGTSLQKVYGEIKDLYGAHPKLLLKGEANGSTQSFLNFVAQSPLSEDLAVLDNLTATGVGKLLLNLELPLTDHSPYKLNGRYILKNNDIRWRSHQPLATIHAVNAEIEFTEKDLLLNRAHGYFAEQEFTAYGNLYSKQGITLHGSTSIATLSRVWGQSTKTLASYLNGRVKYQGKIRINKTLPDILLELDLSDLAINLPYPLEKPQHKPLLARLHWRKKSTDHEQKLSLHIDNLLDAHYLFKSDDTARASVTHGQVYIGAAFEQPRPDIYQPRTNTDPPHKKTPRKKRLLDEHAQIKAQVILDKLNLDQWLAIIDSLSAVQSKTDDFSLSSFLPNQIDAQIDDLTSFGKGWGKTTVKATDQHDNWTIRADNPFLNGKIIWHTANTTEKNTLTAHLHKFYWPQDSQITTATTFSHVALPEVHLQIDDLRVSGFDLGALSLEAHNKKENQENIWMIDALSLKNPHAVLNLNGTWQTSDALLGKQCIDLSHHCAKKSSVNFRLDIFDSGQLLDDFGLSKTLSKGKGKITGSLNWQGSPLKVDYASLSGNFQLALESGTLIGVEPGAVKLLGIFGLQNIVQLGIFDLRGLTSAGLPFSKIGGNAKLTNGVAYTEDLVIESNLATVKMKGKILVNDMMQDLQVTVLPDINLGSASLAYAIINPALGLGSLLVQKALKNPLGAVLAQHYTVKGTWTNPVINRVNAHEKDSPNPP